MKYPKLSPEQKKKALEQFKKMQSVMLDGVVKAYAHYYWTYCLNCKKPMFGMEKETEQNCIITCGSCGARNVFRNSSQPVAVQPSDPPSIALSTGTGDSTGKM